MQLHASKLAQPGPVFNPGDPLRTAQAFVEDRFTRDGLRTLHHYGGQFYVWDGTRYRETEEATIRAKLYHFLELAWRWDSRKDEFVPFSPNRSKVAEVVSALKAEAHLPTNVITVPGWLGADRDKRPDAREIIACSNGLLHLPTRQLLPSTPAFFSTSALSFPYDPDAPEPVGWFKFLDDLWSNDPECISTLQEIFGYLLVQDTRQQKMFLIIGPKRSGKGTIGRVLGGLLGASNVCGPTLASLSKNFGLQPLIGKQLATISDARIRSWASQPAIVERLLSISGEDSLNIDRKYLAPWIGQLPTRILILTNEVPKIEDASGAFASRFIILTLTESFYGCEDRALTGRLRSELPGILNWAIAGWPRLDERGHFVQPQSSTDTARDFEDLGSPIGAFVRDRCVVGPGKMVAISTLFSAYEFWCTQNGSAAPPDVQTFGRDLRAVVPKVKSKQRRVRGAQVRHFIGIELI